MKMSNTHIKTYFICARPFNISMYYCQACNTICGKKKSIHLLVICLTINSLSVQAKIVLLSITYFLWEYEHVESCNLL